MYKAAHISRFNIEYLAWRLDNVIDSILSSVKTHGFYLQSLALNLITNVILWMD